jgi:hypothetical protein
VESFLLGRAQASQIDGTAPMRRDEDITSRLCDAPELPYPCDLPSLIEVRNNRQRINESKEIARVFQRGARSVH